MKRSERILILTLSFGEGHNRAAKALKSEFEKRRPDAEVVLIDALADCSFMFRLLYVRTYYFLIRYAPSLWKRFFRARKSRRDEFTAPVWMWLNGCRPTLNKIANLRPTLTVSCEVGACELAVIARRKGISNSPIVNVITDLEAEPVWVKPEISLYCVPAASVGAQLESWGANVEKIKVCGIPLDESFDRPLDIESAKSQLGICTCEHPVVLLMGGGAGPTRMSDVAAELLQSNEQLELIALPGKDKIALTKLGRLSSSPSVSLTVVEWTDRVADYMHIADVLATKPGGLTMAEAAVCRLPLVLFDAISGPEEENADIFISANAAVKAKDPNAAAAEILALLADLARSEQMRENLGELAKPHAAVDIVVLALELSERNKADLNFSSNTVLHARLCVGEAGPRGVE